MAEVRPGRITASVIGAIGCLSAPVAAQDTDAMLARGRALTARSACELESSDTIVVCGRSDPAGRYRLPLPAERDRTSRGGTLTGAELLSQPGDCAPVGSRRCTKREAASQGLGGGRDPLTLAARLIGRLTDPDR